MKIQNDYDYNTFLTVVINDGIDAATRSYIDDKTERDGAISGFESCRGKSPEDLGVLLRTARGEQQAAFRSQDENYWFFACHATEIEWICNVVSCALINEGRDPIEPYLPTARGMMKAAEVLGVAPLPPGGSGDEERQISHEILVPRERNS